MGNSLGRAPHRLVVALGALLLMFLVGATAFVVARSVQEQVTVRAQEPEDRGPLWYKQLMEQADAAPRFERLINGIRVGPDLDRSGTPCGPAAPAEHASPESSFGSALDPRPTYLPPGTVPGTDPHIIAVDCGGVLAAAQSIYWVPPDLDNGRFGGPIEILRFRGDRVAALDEPSARLSAGEVSGRPAVTSPPLTSDGFGRSAILIAEPYGLTIVRASGMSLDELLRVAESLGVTP